MYSIEKIYQNLILFPYIYLLAKLPPPNYRVDHMNFLRRRNQSAPSDDDSDDVGGSNFQKSRKPPNTAFRQQRLQAWQPILTPKSVISVLFLLAIVFAPLGIAILYTTYHVEKISLDYSHCDTLASGDEFSNVPSKYVDYHFKDNVDPEFQWKLQNGTGADNAQCIVRFTLAKDISPPLYLYYQLTNFYQNHRKYVDSYDLDQLKGEPVSADSLTDKCDPLRVNNDGKAVYPCGLIANSLFNDTFSSPVLLNPQNGENNQTYHFTDKGISWPSDIGTKFRNTTYDPNDIVPPPNWAKRFPQGYNETNLPGLEDWEHLQNWMRTSGLPSFYKLYGKNTTEAMSSGTYEMTIDLHYPVTIFGGTKSVVITTNSIFGGRNLALGIIYIIVAIVCLVLAIAFLFQHLIKPRRIGDHNFLQGQMEPSFRDQL